MSDSGQFRDEHERQLDAIIARYYRAVEEGLPPDQDKFAAQHPEFERDLREFFTNLGLLDGAVPQTADDPALANTRTMSASQRNKLTDGSVVRYFGEYEILGELGTGGMGVVYKARQTRLGRIVALKMIRAGELANPQDVKRFQAETRAAARLTHAGIVAVHEVGIHNGQHFYTMDYVEGGSLSRLHRDEPVPARHAAEIVKQLAEAIHYSHELGIVHRDLKPANILLTKDGSPKITDFGLAKRMWADVDSVEVSMTETGQILGTAGYMSPEQASGKTRLVGPSADIYALGAVLYALLTSRAPFVGESQADTIMQVIHREPVSPRALNPSVARDLETICLKCLEKEAHKRYGTAQLLAEDLARFLDGQPVLARPISRPARAWRWCRRNPVVAGLLVTVGASLLLGAAVSLYFADQAQQRANANLKLADKERDARQIADERKQEADRLTELAETRRQQSDKHAQRADELRQKAEHSAASARRHLYISHMKQVQKSWDQGQINEVHSLLDRYRPADGEEDLRGFEWHYWRQRCNGGLLKLEGSHARYKSNGTQILTFSKGIHTYDGSTGEQISATSERPEIFYNPVLNSDATLVASIESYGTKQPTIVVTDAQTGRSRHRLVGHTAQINRLAFSHDGESLVSSSSDGTLRVWNVLTGEVRAKLDLRNEADQISRRITVASQVLFSPECNDVVYCATNSIQRWRWSGGSPPLTHIEYCDPLQALVFSPDGHYLAGTTEDREIIVWDFANQKVIRRWGTHSTAIIGIAFSLDGNRLATGSHDMTVKLWDVTSGRLMTTFRGHRSVVERVEFSPDGRHVLSSSRGIAFGEIGEARVWDTVASENTSILTGDTTGVASLSISPDGMNLAASNEFGGDIAVWNLDEIRQRPVAKVFGYMANEYVRVGFHPDSTHLAVYNDRVFGIWNAATGQLQTVLSGLQVQPIVSLFNHDGSYVAAGCDNDGALYVWNAQSGKMLRQFRGHKGRVTDIVFAPDGHHVISGDRAGVVVTWSIDTGKVTRRWNADDGGGVTRLRLTSSGKILAVAKDDGRVTLWDASGNNILTLAADPEDRVVDMDFSPDEARLVTVGASLENGRARVWDVISGEEVLTLDAGSPATSVVFLPDGMTLITGHRDARINFWEATSSPRSSAPTSVTELTPRRVLNSGPTLNTVVHSSDGRTALTGGADHIVRLWDLPTGSVLKEFHGHQGAIQALAFSADEDTILSGADDHSLRFWHKASGEQVGQIDGNGSFTSVRRLKSASQFVTSNSDGSIRVVRFPNPAVVSQRNFEFPLKDLTPAPFERDSSRVVVGGAPGKILLCVPQSGGLRFPVKGYPGEVYTLEIIKQRYMNRLLIAGSHHSIQLRGLAASEQLEREYRGHLGAVFGVRVLTDGRRFASCSADRTLRIWDLEDGNELARGVTASAIRGLSVAPDGRTCLTVSDDGSILQWDLPSAESHLRYLLKSDPNNVELQKRLKYAEMRLAKPFASVFTDLTPDEFQWDFDEAVKRGLRPSKRTMSVTDGIILHSGEFIPSENKRWQDRSGQTKTQFEQTNAKMSGEGLALEWHSLVILNGQEIHAATWVSE